MSSINGGGGTKLGMQPKALLKLPKEMPSNIVIQISSLIAIVANN